jgi:integration host factor subunit beta
MTKSELIARLAARYPQLVAKDAEFAVKMILDAMTDSLVKGQRIEIRGFGSFGLNHRPARVGRNPKAGKELRERVDARQAANDAAAAAAAGQPQQAQA